MPAYVVNQTSILNRALQLLGAAPVNSITDGSRSARAMQRAYYPRLYALLRAYPWNFAIKRATLAASAIQPEFGPGNAYPLPPDFLDLCPNDGIYGTLAGNFGSAVAPIHDWRVEGDSIVSSEHGPLQIRYVSSSIPEGRFDPDFAEAFAADLAVNTCEEITQNNAKIQVAQAALEMALQRARQRNAFEKQPIRPSANTWFTARY